MDMVHFVYTACNLRLKEDEDLAIEKDEEEDDILFPERPAKCTFIQKLFGMPYIALYKAVRRFIRKSDECSKFSFSSSFIFSRLFDN
jgi:hypothetical protein